MRVYLDNSVYGMAADNGDAASLRSAFDQNGFAVMLSGTNMQEASRAPADIRLGRYRAMSLMASSIEARPDSLEHTDEFIAEIRRFMPHLLHPEPNLTMTSAYIEDHRRKLRELVSNPNKEPEGVSNNNKFVHEGAGIVRAGQKNEKKITTEPGEMVITSSDPEEAKILSNMDFDDAQWRTHCGEIWAGAISNPSMVSRDYFDFATPHLRSQTVRQSDIRDLWLQHVELRNVPRNYILARTWHHQLRYKLSHGNALDQLHAGYLIGSSYFVTADKILFGVLNDVRTDIQSQETYALRKFKPLAVPVLVDRSSRSTTNAVIKSISAPSNISG